MSKQYLELEGTIYREEGWSEQEMDDFIDEILDIIEYYNGQAALGWCRKSEDDLASTESMTEREIIATYQRNMKGYIHSRKKRRQYS